MKKTVIILSVCIIIPIFLIAIMGVLQGAWFDTEKLLKRPDIEIYQRPMYQYLIYYTVLAMISLLEILLIRFYTKKSKSNYKYVIVGITLFVWCSISVFFIFSIL